MTHTLPTPQTFLEDPIANIAANLRVTAENLSRRLLALSADPEASLDQIGKLQRALTGILSTLKQQPAPEPQAEPLNAPPEITAPEPVAEPTQKQLLREPQEDRTSPHPPEVITPHTPAPEPEPEPKSAPAPEPEPAPAPVPIPPKAPPAPKPTPPKKISPTRHAPPRPHTQKAPKYLRRMMKRARRNQRRPKG